MRSFLVSFMIGVIVGLVVRDYFPEVALEASGDKEVPQKARPRRKPAEKREPDALIDIKGIGPKFEQALLDAGITTFADLVKHDVEVLAEYVGVAAERIERERWIEQAQELIDAE